MLHTKQGSGMSTEEWWAPVIYKTFLDLDMPKEDIDEVFVGVFEELFYDSLTGDWAWEPVEDVLPVSTYLFPVCCLHAII